MAKNITTSATPTHQLRAATAKPIPISNDPRYSGFRVYAYGPEVASASFLRTCPDANARIKSPGTIPIAPKAMNFHVGRASQKYSTANTNPNGTRMRRAVFDHPIFDHPMPDPSAMSTFRQGRRKQRTRRIDYSIDADLQHPFVRLGDTSMRSRARRIAQHDASRPIRPVARWIRRTKDRHHRHLQRCRKVHRPG